MTTSVLTELDVNIKTEVVINDSLPSATENVTVRHPCECAEPAGADAMDIDADPPSSSVLDSTDDATKPSEEAAEVDTKPTTDIPPSDVPPSDTLPDTNPTEDEKLRHPSEWVQYSAAYMMDLEDDSDSSTCSSSGDSDAESTTCTSPTTTAVGDDDASPEDEKMRQAVKSVRFSEEDVVREFEKDKGHTLIVIVSDDGKVGGDGLDDEGGDDSKGRGDVSSEEESDEEEEVRCSRSPTRCSSWAEEREWKEEVEKAKREKMEEENPVAKLVRDEVQRHADEGADKPGETAGEEYLRRERATFRAVYEALEAEIQRLTEVNESMKEVMEEREKEAQDLKRQYEKFWRGVVRDVETKLETMKQGVNDSGATEESPVEQGDSSCSKCAELLEEKTTLQEERLDLEWEQVKLKKECGELRSERDQAIDKCRKLERKSLGLQKNCHKMKVKMREMVALLEDHEQDEHNHSARDLKLVRLRLTHII